MSEPVVLFGATGCDTGCVSTTLDGCASAPFYVGDKPVVIRAFGLTGDAELVIEQVAGCGEGEFFQPLAGCCGCERKLTACGATFILAISGRYRLNGCASAPLPADLYVEIQTLDTNVMMTLGGEDEMASCCPHVAVTENANGSVTIVVDSNVVTIPPPTPAGTAVSVIDAADTITLVVGGVPYVIDKGPDAAQTYAALQAVLGYTNCAGAPLTPGVALATCAEMNTATAAVAATAAAATSAVAAASVNDGDAAGGALNGTYPNPGLVPAAVATAMDLESCTGAAVIPGTAIATCADLNSAIAAIPGNPTTLPPNGPAGGALNGAYPNPGLVPAAVATALGFVDCVGAPHAVGATIPTCADMAADIALGDAPLTGAGVPTVAPVAGQSVWYLDTAVNPHVTYYYNGTLWRKTSPPDDTTSSTAVGHSLLRGLSAGNVDKNQGFAAPVADFAAPGAGNLEVSYRSMIQLFTNAADPANVDANGLAPNGGVMNADGSIGHRAFWSDYQDTATAIGSQQANGTAHRLGTTIASGATIPFAPGRYQGELRYIYAFPNPTSPLEFIKINLGASFIYGPVRTAFGGDTMQKTANEFVLRRGEGIILIARANNQWNVVATAYDTLRGANYAEVSSGVINAWGPTPINIASLPPLASSTIIMGTNGNDMLIGQLA